MQASFEFAVTAQLDDDDFIDTQADEVEGLGMTSFFLFLHDEQEVVGANALECRAAPVASANGLKSNHVLGVGRWA
jgi:hypothetical protein